MTPTAKPLTPSTTLGTSEELRRSGRYAILLGNWWRHPKRQEVGRAAAGLFTDLLSFCADQATDRLNPRQLALIAGGDPNFKRQLRALEKAELVERDPSGGYAISNWYMHNHVPKTVKLRVVRDTPGFDFEAAGAGCDGGVMEVRWTCDESVMNAPPENIQENTPLLKTQDPGPRTPEQKEDPGAAAPSAPQPVEEPPKPQPRARIAELEAAYGAPELLAETRSGIGLSRQHGRITDAVWLSVLERLAKHPAAAALHAMRVYCEHHADGDKAEGYLVAIARNAAKNMQTGRTTGLRKVAPELRAPTAEEVAAGEEFMRSWGAA